MDCDGRKGGLALLWNENNEVRILHYSKNHIQVSKKNNPNQEWFFTGIYGNPDKAMTHETWDLIKYLRKVDGSPWMICWDLTRFLVIQKKLGATLDEATKAIPIGIRSLQSIRSRLLWGSIHLVQSNRGRA